MNPMAKTRNNFQNPRILNLFHLGTTGHCKKNDDILTYFYNGLKNTPDQSHYLINGIGGLPPDEDDENPMVGTYDVKSVNFDRQTGDIQVDKQKNKVFFPKLRSIWDAATARSHHAIIDEIIKVVATVIENSPDRLPLILNLFGFSRGSDSIIRALNILSAMYGRDVFRARLFSLDNVAGTWRKKALRATHIPDCVEEVFYIQKIDESLFIFDNQDKSKIVVQNPKTKTTYQNYRGFHTQGNSLDLSKPEHKPATDPVSSLCYDDLTKFYDRNNYPYTTSSDSSPKLTRDQRLRHYTEMLEDKTLYSRRGTKGRAFVKRMRDYFIHGPNYFVSTEHMLLFHLKYPCAFDYLFQQNQKRQNVTDFALKLELDEIYANTQLRNSLISATYLPADRSKIRPNGIAIPLEHLYQNIRFENSQSLQHQSTPLMLMWESVVKIASPYLSGLLNICNTNNIDMFLDDIYNRLICQQSPEEKLDAIRILIKSYISNIHNDPTFRDKLLVLVKSDATFIKYYSLIKLNQAEEKLRGVLDEKVTEKSRAAVIKALYQFKECETFISNHSNPNRLINDITSKLAALSQTINQTQNAVSRQEKQTVFSANNLLTTFVKNLHPKKTLAELAIAELKRYTSKWLWWRIFRIKTVSTDKRNLALSMINALTELHKAGEGDDRKKIYAILRDGQQKSKLLYYYSLASISADPKKLITSKQIAERPATQTHGSLDKLLLGLLRDLNLKMPMDLFKPKPKSLPSEKVEAVAQASLTIAPM